VSALALILGAGPAGTGPLVNAQQRGLLPRLLDAGVTVVDTQDRMGHGTIGRYRINSDTTGGTFLECLAGQEADLFARVLGTEALRRLDQFRQSAAPLRLVGDFLAEIGGALRHAIDAHPASAFRPSTRAISVRRTADGFATTVEPAGGGEPSEIHSRYVVSALGGRQDRDRALTAPIVPGVRLDRHADRVLLTEQVLTEDGPARLEKMLTTAGHRRVVIVGGSHSAFSSAWVLLNEVSGEFGPGDITMLHRTTPRIFYPTAADAHAEGYTDFGDDDLCPLTGRVYRLAGLRWDSRELLRRIWSVGGAPAEDRVRLRRLDPAVDDGVSALLDEAAVIIPAFGYRPATVPVLDEHGRPVPLSDGGAGRPPLVDDRCRLLGADGRPVPGMFGIGLASGFVLDGPLGGEPSFTGQTNGLWLYQNGIGERIVDQLLAAGPAGPRGGPG
jgi:hypothetical protein